MELFGFDIKKVPDKRDLESFAIDRELTSERLIPESSYGSLAGVNSVPYEFLQTPTEELQLIKNYRELAASAEIDEALQEIRNEIFVFEDGKKAFELDFLEKSKISKSIQNKIVDCFNELYHIIDFDTYGSQYFDDWYVDSKLYLYKVIDQKQPKKGIQKIQFIDPLKIRLVRVLPKPEKDGTYNASLIEEFFVYGSNYAADQSSPLSQPITLQYGQSYTGYKINPDAVTYINSGFFDRSLGLYTGYLKKAIVPYNMLKMMEDAMLIFRVVRAPARRAFYVDVSGLQKNKAEAYMKDLQSKLKNKMTYDTKTGTLADRRNILSMQEDYWLPRRDGGKGTEVATIEGQSSQDIMEEIEYLRDRLWRSLNVPRGRFGENQTVGIFGRGTEIQRDEYRFTKFLQTLRNKFMPAIEDLLKTQLLLKRIIAVEDWDEVRRAIKWVFTEDNTFVENKELELLMARLNVLNMIKDHSGTFYSDDWIKRNVLKQTDKEIKSEEKKMEEERKKRQEMGIPEPGGGNGFDPNFDQGNGGFGGGGDGAAFNGAPAEDPNNPFKNHGGDDPGTDTPPNPFDRD